MEQPNEQDNWHKDISHWTESMSCWGCPQKHGTSKPWYCWVCHEASQQTMKELQGKTSFLAVTDQVHFPADVHLIVENGSEGAPPTQIPAHRLILGSRSPVLRAMLEHPMKENRSGEIHIRDSSPEAVEAFVNYLYSAEVSLDYQLASEELKLAEKYQVMQLKNHCEKFMVSNLNWENSIFSYEIALMHNANLLLEAAESLIKNNLQKLRNHSYYQKLAEENPDIALKMLEACFLAEVERTAAAGISA